jgi:hypothetical protein
VPVSKYFLIVGDGDVRDISFRKKHRSSATYIIKHYGYWKRT